MWKVVDTKGRKHFEGSLKRAREVANILRGQRITAIPVLVNG